MSVPAASWPRALVTGASRGIGRACALALARTGARVIAVARNEAELRTLADESEGRIEPWVDDVRHASFYERMEMLGELDVLVNNAGTNTPLLIQDVDPETLDAMIDLNIRAMFRTSQAAARVMLRAGRGGSIVHMSSQMGHVGAPKRTVYCMTKHAVEGFMKALAVELGPHGIRVNAVAPTFVETELTRPMLNDEAFRRSVLESIPLGRVGQAMDVTGAVLFLVSAQAGLITGHSLKVDGGWTAR
jgi:NAD(P)-dependent dehydrogenase (short-subunit alcohol dehydrogenase family)